jgi:DNA/RNA endonuclease YhcR with UshA esterase domain
MDLGGIIPAASTETPATAVVSKAVPSGDLPEVDPLALEDLLKHEGQSVRIRGKVIQHTTNSSGTMDYLNFTANYRSGLSLIFRRPAEATKFDPASLDAFAGKTVVVEGKIINFRGLPEIEITSLAEIKIAQGGEDVVNASAPAPVAPPPALVQNPAPIPKTPAADFLDARDTGQFLKLEGQPVKIKGRIVRFAAAASAPIYYLNFTDNFRSGLSLVFFQTRNPADFRPEVLRNYVNKTVVVEGLVTTYQGRPQIELKNLNDIKVVDEPGTAQPRDE